jgi:hypothetical protein
VSNKVNKGHFIRDILHSQKKWRLSVAIGAIVLVIGISDAFYFGSIDLTQVVKNNVNPQTGLPNTVNGISPALAQIIFEILIFIGLLVLAYGIATRFTSRNNKLMQ